MRPRHGAVGRLVRKVSRLQDATELTLCEQAERLGISASMLCMLYAGKRQPGLKFLQGVFKAYPHLRDEVRLFLFTDITNSDADDAFW